MNISNNEDTKNLKRINLALRNASLQRNGKTALVLGLAVSGALVGTPWLLATMGGASLYLLASKKTKQ